MVVALGNVDVAHELVGLIGDLHLPLMVLDGGRELAKFHVKNPQTVQYQLYALLVLEVHSQLQELQIVTG